MRQRMWFVAVAVAMATACGQIDATTGGAPQVTSSELAGPGVSSADSSAWRSFVTRTW
jgi:hypothetical protein